MSSASSGHWWTTLIEWADAHSEFLFWVGIGSVLALIASALLVPLVIAGLPEDEFCERRAPKHAWREVHPVVGFLSRATRNAIGALLVLAGIAMLVLPGQGLLSIFVGMLLLEFPGKRRLVLRIVSYTPVRRGLNWLRRRKRKPEFRFGSQESSRNARRMRDDAKSAATTINADSATKKKTSS